MGGVGEEQYEHGASLNEGQLAAQVRKIQLLEKDHLQRRVVINDKIIKLALLDYDLKK